MAVIPKVVLEDAETLRLMQQMLDQGFVLVSQGKVRDTYHHPDLPESRVQLASMRASIFDFVLPVLIPGKGEILTALSHFWMTILSWHPNHLVRSTQVPRYNGAYDLAQRWKGFPLKSSLLVQELDMLKFEMIFRHHLGGSVWKSYEETGVVAGHKLPAGLKRWERLDQPLFTPSTKEEFGHDENITVAQYLLRGGQRHVDMLQAFYMDAYEFAAARGILILDSKFEISEDGDLGDEVLTPDSSRFTTVEDWEAAQREARDPFFYDKQWLRIWGMTVKTPFGVIGINKLDPRITEHVEFVHSLKVPRRLVRDTASRFHDIFYRLTGEHLRDYQRMAMGVA